MLLSSLVSAFALSACFIKGTHQTSHLPSHHPHSRQASAVAASLSNHFDITAGTIERYQPTFKQACQEKKTDVVIQALVHIKDSMSALGSVDVLVEMDVTILTTKVFNLMIKLQVVLKIIEEHQLISSCSGAIVEFKASLQVMISVVASQHTDISAQCKSAGVDLEFYDRVGIKLTLDAKVDVGAGAGGGDGSGSDVGAGVNHDVDASAKVVADFQASVSVTADLQEKVKTACEQKNVDVVVSSLTTIRSSINGLATNVNAFSQVDANVLSTNAISLFVKLQVVLRLISDHGLSSQCQGAIMSLQAPLQTIVGSVGVDASSRIASSVDVNTFTEVGLHVVGTAVGAGHGGIVGTAGGLGGHVDASAKVVTDLHTCISLMQTLELQFKTACDQKNADVLVRGFVSIKTSFEAIGTNNNAFAHIDADILSTNVISLFVRLQVLLRIVSDAKMSTSCQNAMVTLQAPLKSMISVVDSVGIDMSARMAAAVDVNLFTQMGLGMGVNAAVGVLGHLGGHLGGTFGANVDAGASAKAFADFKASTGAVVTLAPTFKTACEQKNVAVLNQGLVSIVASMATVGAHVDVLAHVNADDLCNQYFDLLIKVQILLKIIDQHSLTSSCTGSIGSLNVPLKTFLTVLVSMGVDVSAKAKTYTSLDMSFFTKVGVSLDMRGGASFGV